MPDFFAQWLASLSNNQANQMWEWLDGGDIDNAIVHLVDTHEQLKRLTTTIDNDTNV